MRGFVASTLVGLSAVTLAVMPTASASAANGWQKPVHVSTALEGVSCVSTTFCMAVDPLGQSYVYDGSTWSSPIQIMDEVYGYGLSCTSTKFCMAVNSFAESASWTTFDGSQWSAPAQLSGATQLVALGCASSTFCMASDTDGNIYQYGPNGWGKGKLLLGARKISCPTTTFCMAFGGASASIYNGTRWSKPVTVLHAQASFWSGSCPVAGACMGLDTNGRVFTYQGGQWSRATKVERRNRQPRALSCGSVNLCVVTDDSGHASMGSFGGSWTSQRITRGRVGQNYMDVSCHADSFCMAVNRSGDAIKYSG